jgi:DNA-binding XRE family transcriptional regulator
MKVTIEAAKFGSRSPATAKAEVTSEERGESLAELVETFEQNEPEVVAKFDLSSASLRAADLIRTMRKKARLSQAQLAEKLGVKQTRVSELEAGIGRQGPTWAVMERVAKACGQRIGAQPAISITAGGKVTARKVHDVA